jgi:protein-disulfide isomerase
VGYWHAAYQGEPSIRAAEASECAADQDAFWPYHDRLVEALAVEGNREFTAEDLNQYAEELELDTETFSECLASGKYNQLVIQQTIASQSDYMVRGTPMFLVNGRMVSGAQPFEAFQQVIDMSLSS